MSKANDLLESDVGGRLMPKQVEPMTVEQRRAAGKAARAALPRERHGEWSPSQRTHDPLELLAQQAQTRVAELVPIRHGRMAVSPFSYYRGRLCPWPPTWPPRRTRG
jgi:hypothetical protein